MLSQRFHRSLNHAALADAIVNSDELLIVQDLDGVCMGLVRDPLTRQLDREYLEAVPALGRHFRVLTNGEHIGRRGVNGLVDRSLASAECAGREGLYLPGLAGGGVQFQDAHGAVSHPGVSEAELAFLAGVATNAQAALSRTLAEPPFALPTSERHSLLRSSILDNRVSPTINLNPLFERFGDEPELFRQLQLFSLEFLQDTLKQAEHEGFANSFYIHLAPNRGRDERGERLLLSDGNSAGTTDFQFMLSGAVKEVGVLVLLNHYLGERDACYPFGDDFNARSAPRQHDALLELAERRLRDIQLPRLVGVGDTVTSNADEIGGMQRGGSDRGFLTLLQALGERLAGDNLTVFVDSSGGEVRRPGITGLERLGGDSVDWPSLRGISDPQDPLTLNFLFPGGHDEYIAFFRALAARFRGRGAQVEGLRQ